MHALINTLLQLSRGGFGGWYS